MILGVLLLLSIGLANCATPSPAPSGQGSSEVGAPAYALGQKWHRVDGEYELTRIEGDRYVFTHRRSVGNVGEAMQRSCS